MNIYPSLALACCLVCACAGTAVPTFDPAEAKRQCSGTTFAPVRSLTELPEQVRALLDARVAGLTGMADIGSPYNATDFVQPGLPMRRLYRAATSPRCIHVEVERGGIARFVDLWIFGLDDAAWKVLYQGRAAGAPLSFPATVPRANR